MARNKNNYNKNNRNKNKRNNKRNKKNSSKSNHVFIPKFHWNQNKVLRCCGLEMEKVGSKINVIAIILILKADEVKD